VFGFLLACLWKRGPKKTELFPDNYSEANHNIKMSSEIAFSEAQSADKSDDDIKNIKKVRMSDFGSCRRFES
jgi:hypothetical protein